MAHMAADLKGLAACAGAGSRGNTANVWSFDINDAGDAHAGGAGTEAMAAFHAGIAGTDGSALPLLGLVAVASARPTTTL